ncbi:insulinase family protein [bacterium]|nr:insulinase family protein [bacterium]
MNCSRALRPLTLLTCAFVSSSGFAAKTAANQNTQIALKLPPGATMTAVGKAIEGTPDVYRFKLANGMKVLILPDNRNPLATLRIKLDAGSNREKPGTTGLAHFFEHMMFRKTQVTPEGYYDRILAGVGGRGNAGTSTDYVVYESSFPGPALDKLLTVESQRFKFLDLQDPYFTTEKGAVISERRLRYENDPLQRGQEILRKAAYRGTPYEWLTIGAKKDVELMSIEEARSFYRDFYTPDNAQLFLGGPFNVETALQKINDTFGDWQGKIKNNTSRRAERPEQEVAGKEFVCSENIFEEQHSIVFPSNDNSYRSSILAQVLMQILNDNPDGTIQRRMTKQKLATAFAVYKTTWQKNSQPYVAWFKLNKQQSFEAARDYFYKELQAALSRPMTQELKSVLLKQQEVEESDVAQKMTSLVEFYEWNEFFYGDFRVSGQTKKIIEDLTTKEFQTWGRNAFSPKKAFRTGVTAPGKAMPCSEFEKTASLPK